MKSGHNIEAILGRIYRIYKLLSIIINVGIAVKLDYFYINYIFLKVHLICYIVYHAIFDCNINYILFSDINVSCV